MSVEVKNTICFHFPDGSERPTYDDIANFIKALDADLVQMEASYRIPDERALYVKFKCEEAMLHALTSNEEVLDFHYASGEKVQVRLTEAGDYIQYVRVFGMVPEIPDRELAAVLGKYGKVKRVIREKFPAGCGLDLYTGVRGVYVDVKKEIPSSLNFLNRKGYISYDGNKLKCFLCKAEGHRMDSCPKRKTRKRSEKQQKDLEQKQDEDKRDQDGATSASKSDSYAGVVAGEAATETIEVLDEEVMAIDEMIPETEENGKKEEKASGSKQPVYFDYRKDPTYLMAKKLFDQQQQDQSKAKSDERVKLRAKGSRKQSPPRKK